MPHLIVNVRHSLLLLSLLVATIAKADLSVHDLFQDHLVIQRDRPVPVWGSGSPGETVQVTFGQQQRQTVVQPDGNWQLELAAEPANATGRLLTISGSRTIEIADVLVGEVWLASGQSNMWWPVKRADGAAEARDTAGQYSHVRLFQVPGTASTRHRQAVPGTWQISSEQTVGDFSAVAYYFARQLADDLQVPIGVIHASVRGTAIEPWMPLSALQVVSEPNPVLADWQRGNDPGLEMYPNLGDDLYSAWERSKEELAAYMQQWEAMREQGIEDPIKQMSEETLHRRKQSLKVHIYAKKDVPGAFYHGMIQPLAPYALRGVVWYQGESNALRDDITTDRYAELLRTMIASWRQTWQTPELPFLLVGLANFTPRKNHYQGGWPLVREAQTRIADEDAHVSLATIIDIGDATNVHPGNKLDVGRRLALLARRDLYGHDVVAAGPRLARVERLAAGLRLHFAHANGLQATADPLTGFEIRSVTGDWQPVTAQLHDDTVLLGGAADATAIRYAWADNPDSTLHNAVGLPAEPFLHQLKEAE